jgi:hypothetical protein
MERWKRCCSLCPYLFLAHVKDKVTNPLRKVSGAEASPETRLTK